MPTEKMMFGARRLVSHCADVKPGEQGLVVTDTATDPAIAEAIAAALREVGAAAAVIRTDEARTDSGDVAPAVAAAMLDRLLHRSVVLNLDGDSYRLRDHHARAEKLRRATTGTRQPLQ